MTSYAEKVRANLERLAKQAIPIQAPDPANPNIPRNSRNAHPFTPIDILLAEFNIDLHQPRTGIPPRLREAIAHQDLAPSVALVELLALAEQDNAEATGYLDGLRTLAYSIAEVGLQQPLRVSVETDKQGQTRYRIVDGERRYWAALYLNYLADQHLDQATPITSLPGILHDPAAKADAIQRAQWAANIHRADISAVDFAQALWQIREDYRSRLAIDFDRFIAELGDDAANLPPGEAANQLAAREIARLTGKPLARRQLYRYLAVAEKLCDGAKTIARAHSLPLRQLALLARRNPQQQLDAIYKTIGHANPIISPSHHPPISQPMPTPAKAGRPSTLHRSINICAIAINVLQRLSPRNLAAHGSEDKRVLLDELRAVISTAEQAMQLIAPQLASAARDTTDPLDSAAHQMNSVVPHT